MNTFLFLRLLLNFFELLAAVSGIIYWGKIKHSFWKWFAVYLIVITITEIVNEYVGYLLKNGLLNSAIVNYFNIPLQFTFFFWLFYKWLPNEKGKKWPVIGFGVYVVSFIVEFIYFSNDKYSFYSFSYITGNIVLLLLTLFFLYGFFRSEKILNYRSNMMFWVCIGVLIFYLGSLPLYGLWNTLVAKYPTFFDTYWIVMISLNYLMYLCFTISFIWGNPK